jgi:uncharacterized protein (DUF362 family)
MTEFTRKQFLRLISASLGTLGGVYLSGCLSQNKLINKSLSTGKIAPTETLLNPTVTQLPVTDTPAPTVPPENTPTPVSMAYPDLVVARNGEPEEMIQAALSALGGMKRFVNQGDVVVVKPNICISYYGYEYAATTNPWVVGAIVKLALDAGAKKVKVMDFPFGGTGERAYQVSGIQAEVQKAGGTMVEMTGKFKFVDTAIPKGQVLNSTPIYDEVLNADVLINVPIAKNHGLARLTLAMKNMMGVILYREMMHSNLGQKLADLNSRVKSHLVIVDAVRMLMQNGPTGGSLNYVRKANTIIASPDIVAADSYAATLFGLKPNDLSYIKKGYNLGLGNKHLNELKIEEISLG